MNVTPPEHEQLELLDPFDDGRTFGEWLEGLPLDPGESPRGSAGTQTGEGETG